MRYNSRNCRKRLNQLMSWGDMMEKKEKTPKPKKDGSFSKSVIMAIIVSVIIFTIAVLVVFVVTGGIEPSTLIISFYGFFGFECGVLGWIKSVKEKEKQEKLKSDSDKERKDKE